MFTSRVFLSLVLVTLTAVDAISIDRRTGKNTLRFTTKINEAGDLNIADRDRARAQVMRQSGQLKKRSSTMAINTGVSYVAQVGVGSPPTDYTLLIDTGSSNTWVGARQPYVQSKTSRNTGMSVSVSYGSGSFSGVEWVDAVTLGPGLVISEQSIGVASQSTGISEDVDGILGVGPVDLTVGTVDGVNTVPTVVDSLYSQRTISTKELGVYFIPKPSSTSRSGELTFGDYDSDVTVGPVFYFPLTKTKPAAEFWGIDQSIVYGVDTILPATAGIVDTGTTLILIATDAFNKYKGMTGGTPDSATGLLKITEEQYQNLKPLVFNVLGEPSVPFVLTPNAQIWPRSLNAAIGGTADGIYLVISDMGSQSGSGLDFINGYAFLERYYSVYDNSRVGFALTEYTFSEDN